MKHMSTEIFNALTETHFQFKSQHPGEKSLLFPAIQDVLKCDEKEAEKLGSTHCNLISMYAPLRAKSLYNKEYDSFFKDCLDSKYVTKQGYISDKVLLMKYLKIDTPLTTFRAFEDIEKPLARLDCTKFYQIKIKSRTDGGGDHFLSSYIKNEVLYISDTSFRGIGVPALDFINADNFQKIMEVC